eukprot:TRINITY_DN8638_c0_g1_i1.p1 TRINITY_DN8638_c0_g1~~TRINITY_DN8638_c0_g1_i1.p1  ORF type:complete len:560 (+),score=117.58 TRINITY_DN8638_c0_g1_i1:305-1984(+)
MSTSTSSPSCPRRMTGTPPLRSPRSATSPRGPPGPRGRSPMTPTPDRNRAQTAIDSPTLGQRTPERPVTLAQAGRRHSAATVGAPYAPRRPNAPSPRPSRPTAPSPSPRSMSPARLSSPPPRRTSLEELVIPRRSNPTTLEEALSQITQLEDLLHKAQRMIKERNNDVLNFTSQPSGLSSSLSPTQSRRGTMSSVTESFGVSPMDDLGPEMDALFTPQDEGSRKRMPVVRELVETEGVYVRDLYIIVHKFYLPLATSKSLQVDKDAIEKVFCNVKALYEFHEGIASDYARRIREQSECFADVLLAHVDEFMKYIAYTMNHGSAVQIAEKLLIENADFKLFIETTQSRMKGLNFYDFLIKPVQRVMKYCPLLETILKFTSPTHPDYDNIVAALDRIRKVLEYINERKRLQENYAKIDVIVQSVEGAKDLNLPKPQRRFRLEGELVIAFGPKNTGEKTYYCFLFNDMLMYTKKNKEGSKFPYTLRGVQDLENLKMTFVGANACEMYNDDGEERRRVLAFKALKAEVKWMKEVRQSVGDAQRRKLNTNGSFIGARRRGTTVV